MNWIRVILTLLLIIKDVLFLIRQEKEKKRRLERLKDIRVAINDAIKTKNTKALEDIVNGNNN